jgi:hypothetical protein
VLFRKPSVRSEGFSLRWSGVCSGPCHAAATSSVPSLYWIGSVRARRVPNIRALSEHHSDESAAAHTDAWTDRSRAGHDNAPGMRFAPRADGAGQRGELSCAYAVVKPSVQYLPILGGLGPQVRSGHSGRRGMT